MNDDENDRIAAQVAARFFRPDLWTDEERAAFDKACADIGEAFYRPNPLYEVCMRRAAEREASGG